ncbi:MAG: hypothetical protein U5L96_11535 [Owenweeksia sp.]|nr:hypothetical protein [Owenweeksia sp.]
MPLVLIAIVTSFHLYKPTPKPNIHNHYRQQHPFYTGMFMPNQKEPGLTDLSELHRLDSATSANFEIVSLYLAWGDKERHALPMTYLEKVSCEEFTSHDHLGALGFGVSASTQGDP